MANVMIEDRDIDTETLFAYVEEKKLKLFEGWMPRYIGEIYLNMGVRHLDKAEIWIKTAIQIHKRHAMRWYLARDYAQYAELLKRRSEITEAKENIIKSRDLYRECGADRWAEKAEKEIQLLS